MNRFCIVLLLAFAPLAGAADKPLADWPKHADRVVVRAFFDDAETLNGLTRERAPWTVNSVKKYLIIDVNEADYADMIDAGFRVEIDVARTVALTTPRRIRADQRAGIPGFECYRTVTETFATAMQLVADFPNLAAWSDIGDSWEKDNGFGGDDLQVLKLTNSAVAGSKPRLFIMSSIHAREYATAELNTRFGEYLLNNYGSDADATWLLDYHEVHLLLLTNPDGRRQAQTGILWRKNTNQNYCGATSSNRGADLNRNFEIGWGCCGGSSTNQCAETYRGPGAGSEPESAAVMAYVRSIFDDNRGPGPDDAAPLDTPGIFIDLHSFGQLVIWPWGNTGTAAPNATQLQTLGRRFAFFNGYFPEQAIGLGVTDGTTDDFAYGELGVAAFTYELGNAFFQDCGTFEDSLWPDNLQSLIYAAKNARAPYISASGPEAVAPALSDAAVVLGAVTTLSATVDDSRFNNSNGSEAVQPIAAAQYTLDTPPWDGAATPVAMSAADGSFNSFAETVSADIDSTGLSAGQHIVYVRGQDVTGTWGPVSAAFLYVVDPASAPRIAGRIVAADTGLPLQATVAAGGFSAITDANGDYELLLVAGTYTLEITPDDAAYGAQVTDALTVANFDTLTENVALYPFCDLFTDDMETAGVAWTAQGSWARTDAVSNSPTFSYTDSPSGNYGNNVNASLISPPLDLSDVGRIELEFASRCTTEATFDFCIVEVSADGNNWSELGRFDGTESSFSQRSFTTDALAGAAGGQIRFRLSTDVTVTRDGWYLDDVRVRGSGAQCVAASDADGDGVNDLVDNCTLVANPTQLDTNADGFGNACDPDLDDNNVVNVVDLGLLRQSFFAVGVSDSDFNGDGATNAADLGIMKAFFFGPPGPSAQSSR